MNHSFAFYTRIISVLAAIAGLFLLWPGNLFFLNDDFVHLYLTSQGKWLQQNSLRPVCDLSMWIDYKIWGLNAVGFHITNAVLHIVNTILVYFVSKKFLQRYNQAGVSGTSALLISCLFFVYAFHSETIYWVIGRSASLGAIAFLLSFFFYLGRNVSKHFLLSQVFLIVGLFTYESVFILPLVFLILSWMDVRLRITSWKREAGYLVASIVVMLVYLIVRYLLIGQFVAEYEAGKFINMDVAGIVSNAGKLVGRSFSMQAGPLLLVVTIFFFTLAAVTSFLFSRQKLFIIALMVLWLISYLPYLSLGVDTFGSEGERYLYLPSIFLCIIIGIGIINAAKGFKYVISIVYFILHVALLYNARERYVVASMVTSETIQQVKQLEKPTLYVVRLPEENNGALIFRDGFEEAVKLFKLDKQEIEVKVLSTSKGNYSFFNGVVEQGWMYGLPGVEGKAAVFDYSNSTLSVYQ